MALYPWQSNTLTTEAVRQWCNARVDSDPNICLCRGTGWMLSDWDTEHMCPAHYAGQMSPESLAYEDICRSERRQEWLNNPHEMFLWHWDDNPLNVIEYQGWESMHIVLA